MSKLVDTDWAYLAGFIDGEGCIQCVGASTWPKITISQVHHESLRTLRNRFNCIGTLRVKKGRHYGIHARLTWGIHKQLDVYEVLSSVLPYLILKKPQAELALKMYGMDLNERKVASKRLQEMKQEGKVVQVGGME